MVLCVTTVWHTRHHIDHYTDQHLLTNPAITVIRSVTLLSSVLSLSPDGAIKDFHFKDWDVRTNLDKKVISLATGSHLMLEESSLQGRHWLSLLFWSSSWKLLIEEILCKWSNCEITSSHRVVSLAGQPGEVDAVYFCLSIDNSILHSIIGTVLWAETSSQESPLIG